MYAIELKNFTKDYGNEKGVFDVSLCIEPGEVYGYLGPNGAGKSTTIRHLMGFSRPQAGSVRIKNMDCWSRQKEIHQKVGYLPGEISFPHDMTGSAYLKLISQMRRMKDFSYGEKLLNFFEIDPHMNIKKMSKGMKQKIGIVSAFMHDPDILLLDEPTSGLDPLMQSRFIRLIEEEKQRGKTILLSSHIFDEVEKTCDRLGMIRNGRLIQQVTVDEMRSSQFKTYTIAFTDACSLQRAINAWPHAEYSKEKLQITLSVTDEEINHLILVLSKCRVASLREEKHTLEEYFMKFYGGGNND